MPAVAAPVRDVKVTIPYRPRNWARPFHATLKRFAALVLHRRAGKTTALMNQHLRAAMDNEWERKRLLRVRPTLSEAELKELMFPPGGRHYGHVMPTRVQAKQTVWDRLKYYAAVIPGCKPNESELLLRLPTGHKIQLFGADDPDSLRGLGPSGVSFDEFSQQPANIFSEIISKALGDHLGYAIFAGTIKGKDHLYKTYEATKDDPEWCSLWQDIDRSLATEDGITIQLLEQAMADDRAQIAQGLMTQDEYDQEWYLSHEAAIKGAIYGKELTAARLAGRITTVPHDPALPVMTYWDLGMHMVIWFAQESRSGETRCIDYYESGDSSSLPECAAVLKGKPYVYARHVAPHDIVVKELATGRSRQESAAALGIRFEIAPKVSLEDGINASKLLLPRTWFDADKCKAGLEALRNYRRKFNARLNQFELEPEHNWACVAGDTNVLTRYGMRQIQYLPQTGEVLTPCGWKTYENPRLTRRAALLVAVTFDDGLTVRCTPDHRFLAANEWIFAGDLQTGSLIQSCLTRSRSISMAVSIGYGRRSGITRAVAGSYIVRSGKRHLARFLPAITFIIATTTRHITRSRIWSACRRASIWLARFDVELTSTVLWSSTPPLVPALPLGMALRLDASGTVDTLNVANRGRNGGESLSPVRGAARSWMHWFVRTGSRRSSAPKAAKPLRIAAVVRLRDAADVWCLTVPDGHAWSLANGAVTHNSHGADGYRYLAVSHRAPAPPPPLPEPYRPVAAWS